MLNKVFLIWFIKRKTNVTDKLLLQREVRIAIGPESGNHLLICNYNRELSVVQGVSQKRSG